MAIQAALAGLNIAASAIPLFVGENNIFSGKARQASRELEKTFRRGQAMEDITPELARVAQQRQMRASQGLGGTALGLYKQRQNQALGAGMQSLRYQRPGSALAGTGALVGQGMQGAMELALADEQARERNRMLSEQTQVDVGQQRMMSQLRKQQEASDYWGTRKAEANAAVSGALSGIGQAAGTALAFGGFTKTPTTTVDAEALGKQQMAGLLSKFRASTPQNIGGTLSASRFGSMQGLQGNIQQSMIDKLIGNRPQFIGSMPTPTPKKGRR